MVAKKRRSTSETFVLVHGSWHGGWAWQAVIRNLAEKGHHAHAPTLPGHGPRVMRAGITHQDCVDTVVTYIQQHGFNDIILGSQFWGIGHSESGGTAPEPDRPDSFPGCAYTRGSRMRVR
jgi:pimeloyl-ACP methyl ester carboxylesterase